MTREPVFGIICDVYIHVAGQLVLASKPFVAEFTFKWRLSTMVEFVH
jgi:hypothetical protein